MTRREELLIARDEREKERRVHADEAHEARLKREEAEDELRKLDREELKAAREQEKDV